MSKSITYVDGYAYVQVGETYWPACNRCGGSGYTSFEWVENGLCFKCNGRGTVVVVGLSLAGAEKRAAERRRVSERAATRRRERAEFQAAERKRGIESFARTHPALYGFLQSCTSGFAGSLAEQLRERGMLSEKQVESGYAAMERAAERAVREAERAVLSKPVGEPGEKVTVTATVETVKNIEGNYGTTRLLVLVTEGLSTVKTFTTANWAWEVEKGETLTLTGTVKKNETYNGVSYSVLTRCKVSQ